MTEESKSKGIFDKGLLPEEEKTETAPQQQFPSEEEESKMATTYAKPKGNLSNRSIYFTCLNMLFEKEKLKSKLCVLQQMTLQDTQPKPDGVQKADERFEKAIKALRNLYHKMDKLVADLRLQVKDEEQEEYESFDRYLKAMSTKLSKTSSASVQLLQVLNLYSKQKNQADVTVRDTMNRS